ncbi:glycosyltransferase [Halorubrum laminariae]|uniref:glycosyltransferase n=1 Tax=Halorubrum laminariae TaxID=1433523 RepID=UPI002112D1C9|nr:glycosyltransferase [Halorubrum laminariae]
MAVLHEAAFEYGGGMRVVDSLGSELGADIIIGFSTEEVARKSRNNPRILWNREVHGGTSRAIQSIMKFPFVSLQQYDVVIQSGSGTHWYIPKGDQKIIRYVHSIPLSYRENGFLDKISRILRKPTVETANRYVANSDQTSEEIKNYLGKDSEVIYPPVDTNAFSAKKGEGFVTISRLTEEKGVREVVEFFNSRDESLTVVGSGPLLEELEAISEENVRITGWVSEEKKKDILREGGVFVLNSGNESFGIAPIEAMASGMPVVARRGGYTPNQVKDGFNGILFESLEDGIRRFLSEGVDATPEEIVHESEKYSIESFTADFQRIISEEI